MAVSACSLRRWVGAAAAALCVGFAAAPALGAATNVAAIPRATLDPPRVTTVVAGALRPLPLAAAPLRLAGLVFTTSARGFAAAYRCGGLPVSCDGAVLTTNDGGTRWTVAAAFPRPVTHVGAAGPGFVWAWGPRSAYASDDGGGSWRPLSLPPHLNGPDPLMFVSFASPADGWRAIGGVGSGGCAMQGCGVSVAVTQDGGRTWSTVAGDRFPGAPARRGDVLPWADFVDGGYLGGGRGWLLSRTPIGALFVGTGNGRAWHTAPLALSGGGGPVQAAFGGAADGWAAALIRGVAAHTPRSRVYVTTDGGSHWRVLAAVTPPVVRLQPALDGDAAWALTSDLPLSTCSFGALCATGVAVLGSHGEAATARSSGALQLADLAALNGTRAWALATGSGPGQSIAETMDGGRSWRVVYRADGTDSPGPLWGFWTAHEGWAIGSSVDPRAILVTRDAGATWTRTGTLPVQSALDGGFASTAIGWVRSGRGRLWITTDGGGTWAQGAPRGCPLVQAAGFAADGAGWVLASGGAACPGEQLFVTPDAGATWRAALTPGTVWSAAFITPRRGFAVVSPFGGGPGLRLLEATRDGGRSWTPVAAVRPPGVALRVDAGGGLWLGALRSSDGGRTWVRYRLPSAAGAWNAGSAFLPDAGAAPAFGGFVNADDGWLQAGGGLYRSRDGGRTWAQVAAG